MQVPFATRVTELPETVQFEEVVEANVTAKFDDAVALTLKGVSDRSRLVRAPKVIVWFDFEIVKVAIVGVEAFQFRVLAAIEDKSQLPAEVHERVVPEILQLAVPMSETS